MSVLEGLQVPSDWSWRRLDDLVRHRREVGDTSLPLLGVSVARGVVPREADEGRAASEDLSGYRVVRAGDLVVNRLVARDGAFGVAPIDGLVSPAYWVLVPRPTVNSSYLNYLLHSAPALAEIKRLSKDMPPAQFDLPWPLAKSMRLPVPDRATQDQVVARLDRELSRVADLDRALHAFQSSVADADTAFLRFIREYALAPPRLPGDCWIGLPSGWLSVPLGRLLRELTNGYVGPTRDLFVDEGVPYIQSTHIKDGAIDFARRPYFVRPDWHRARPRINLRQGDLLIVQTGKLGEIAQVPEGFGDASCHALLIARARSEIVSSDFLSAWFSCYFGRASLLRMTTGALHPHLEAGEIRKVHVLVPPSATQAAFVSLWREQHRKRREVARVVETMSAALAEYRSSLVLSELTNVPSSETAEPVLS